MSTPSKKNRYAKRSKLSEKAFRQLVTLFALNLDATAIARAVGLSRNTVNAYLKKIRMRMAERCLVNSPLFSAPGSAGCFFLASRPRRQSRGGSSSPVLFGLVNDRGQVYVEPFPLGETAALKTLIHGRLQVDFSMRGDGWRARRETCDLELLDPQAGGRSDGGGRWEIDRAERFLAVFRERIVALRGLKPETFRLHLKECEFRFNTPQIHLAAALLDLFRHAPLRDLEESLTETISK